MCRVKTYEDYFETEQGVPVMDIGGGLSFQLFLYDPSDTVLTTWDKSYSFDIAPGKSYKVGLSSRKYLDSSGFTNCIPEGKMGVLKYYERGYNQMLCVSECYTEIEFETCGCVTVSQMFFPNDTLECGTLTMTMCSLNQEQLLERCLRSCNPQCGFTKYNFERTFAKFPNPGFIEYLKSVAPDEEVSGNYSRKNYGELVINFSSLIVQQTTILPKYEIFSAGSAMGGLLGLMLGGSILTVYELAELLGGLLYAVVQLAARKIIQRSSLAKVADIRS
ncbi:amiloride-sensitive sodium channel subunit alpha-like [Symsagittifera roscoffensis]|uniref:amiloride-sensitive sodium channel subunit alpha-like n=1 Tax=Symsagittifera roscoffensis TaxID=84072 RepID=UPI00307C0874